MYALVVVRMESLFFFVLYAQLCSVANKINFWCIAYVDAIGKTFYETLLCTAANWAMDSMAFGAFLRGGKYGVSSLLVSAGHFCNISTENNILCYAA